MSSAELVYFDKQINHPKQAGRTPQVPIGPKLLYLPFGNIILVRYLVLV